MGFLPPVVFALALTASPGPPAPPAAPPPPAATCREPAALKALPGCLVRECTHREYDEAELQSGPLDASGEFPRALVEGQTAVLTYACPREKDLKALAQAAQRTVLRAGFSLVYAGGMYYNDLPGFTARKGADWIQVVSEPLDEGPAYTVTAVRAAGPGPQPKKAPGRKTGAPPRVAPKSN